jgi:protein SCO1/2
MARWVAIPLVAWCVLTSVQAQPTDAKVGVDEKLGNVIPLDTVFLDEDGKPVPLRALITKPTLLTLVYYECPNICSPLLNGLADTLDRTDMEPGRDYQVLTISFDDTETSALAAQKKKNYLKTFHRPFPESAWRFMTGDARSIAALTDAVGFRFQRTGKDFNHAGVITVLAADGKITRYLHGITFLPFDIKMSLIEASKGKTMPPLNRVLAFCYSYDPEGRRYAFNFLKVVGVVVVTFLALFVAWLVITTKRHRKGLA